METTHLLAQALSLSGLIGASAAYAGMIRRRSRRIQDELAAAQASAAAIERVERSRALAHLDRTYLKGHYPYPRRARPGER